ncbi:DUF2845 domain-containing protein [Pseudomonas tohonis]|uniref:DUF2845 domain-containing protein n=1 Tax=Pseudomonas tohonis TaxID=2725477 RepID=UPI0021D893F8|nr:DUF2845 domain-containing protein [Pseudomonas tohonis]UXY50501.1 DUF2845 domain-containing protein [Pseudomonas tohonis]
MNRIIPHALLTLVLAAAWVAPAQALTLRCSGGLVQQDDSLEDVLRKCGEPDSRVRTLPALRNNGVPKLNAVTVDIWTYGPRNGMTRELRFIEGKLKEVRSSRD